MIIARDARPRRARHAVLVYHRIGSRAGPPDSLCTFVEQFAAQMRYLVEMGFRSVPPGGGADPAPRSIAITFDDGYLDAYTTAFPLLERVGLTATVFLVSGCVGTTSGGWGPRTPAPLMTCSQIREMQRHGISFQSHTRTHADLRQRTDAAALHELATSRAEIEDRLGVQVDAVAYPFGSFDSRISELAERAGYTSGWAAGLAAGTALSGERFEITAKDTMATFAVKASGWGGWLRRARAHLRGDLRSSGPPGGMGAKPC
jgi:peptidoglycan/xylan/chitin deacetylase (PgdA/CDA1 family)